MSDLATAVLEATIRTATPLLLAALGETVTERAGTINLGLEGAIVAGAFGALAGAGIAGVAGGTVVALAAGVAVAALFALLVVRLDADPIITGTAVTLAALGVTGTLYRTTYGSGGAALGIETTAPIALPGLAAIPVLGPALFRQPAFSYVAFALVPLLGWWLFRTHGGLALRACGENERAARTAGVRTARVRAGAILVGGALGGLAGATLVLAQAGTFAEGISAGRGFIAIAVVTLGRRHPVGVLLASLVFGLASAVQYVLQAIGTTLPYQLFLALPYVLTLVALAVTAERKAAGARR